MKIVSLIILALILNACSQAEDKKLQLTFVFNDYLQKDIAVEHINSLDLPELEMSNDLKDDEWTAKCNLEFSKESIDQLFSDKGAFQMVKLLDLEMFLNDIPGLSDFNSEIVNTRKNGQILDFPVQLVPDIIQTIESYKTDSNFDWIGYCIDTNFSLAAQVARLAFYRTEDVIEFGHLVNKLSFEIYPEEEEYEEPLQITNIGFRDEGVNMLADLTQQMEGYYIAVICHGNVTSMPNINSPITMGELQFTGLKTIAPFLRALLLKETDCKDLTVEFL